MPIPTQIFREIQTCDLYAIKRTISVHPHCLQLRQVQTGKTPLHVAVETGDAAVVREVINHGAMWDIGDNNSNMPLHTACELGNNAVIRELLVNPEMRACLNFQNRDGMTPLHIAAIRGNRALCQKLIELGARVDHFDKFGHSPMEYLKKKDPEPAVQPRRQSMAPAPMSTRPHSFHQSVAPAPSYRDRDDFGRNNFRPPSRSMMTRSVAPRQIRLAHPDADMLELARAHRTRSMDVYDLAGHDSMPRHNRHSYGQMQSHAPELGRDMSMGRELGRDMSRARSYDDMVLEREAPPPPVMMQAPPPAPPPPPQVVVEKQVIVEKPTLVKDMDMQAQVQSLETRLQKLEVLLEQQNKVIAEYEKKLQTVAKVVDEHEERIIGHDDKVTQFDTDIETLWSGVVWSPSALEPADGAENAQDAKKG